MKAQDLQPGDTFKRNGHNAYREVENVKDLDLSPKPTVVMRGKLQVTCTNGDSFWIYKTDKVHIKKETKTA